MAYSRTIWVNDSLPAINAENLNKIENGIEKSYILKNLFSNNYMVLANLTYSNGTYTQKTADTSTDLSWKIQAFNNDSYVKIINTLTSNELSRKSMNFTKDNTFNNINFGLNGSSKDSVIKINVSDLEDGKTYTISWNLLNNVQGSIAWNEIQIEEGNNATSYSNFVGVIVESGSNDNGSWVKYSDGTMICNGKTDKSLFGGNDQSYYTEVQGIKIYRSDDPWVNFPLSFADNKVTLSLSVENTSAGCRLQIPRIADINTNSFHIQLLALEDFYNNGLAMQSILYVHWQAIGRWK